MIGGVTRRASSQVFVGRVAELERLSDAFDRATRGQPAVVLIAGEAGVGKSRLLAEFVERVEAAGALSITGGCLDVGEGGLPYAPFVEAFRALARDPDPTVMESPFEPWRRDLGAPIPDLHRTSSDAAAVDPAEPSDRLAQLFDAVIGTLGRQSEARPLVLILEDLHWADGSSRDLLRFLVRNIRDERLLILCTYRSDDLHRRHALMPLLGELERGDRVERLDLRPFGRDELLEQLTSILGETPAPALVDSLLERSDGLPFYVEELIAGSEQSGATLPPTLRDILGLRLATLSRQASELVRAAAVIGGRFSHARLAATFDRDEDTLMAALRDAIDGRILVSSDGADEPGYAFRHALLREAALEELLPAERVRLHARIADLLEASILSTATPETSVIADFALHAYEARDQPRALEGSVHALRAFVATAAYREALSHAERALELWPRVDDAAARVGMDHPDLLILASQSASATRQPERAVLLAQEGLGELPPEGHRDRRAKLLADLFMIAWEAEDYQTSHAAVEEAFTLVEDTGPSPLKAFVVLSLGFDRWWSDQVGESLRLCEELMAMSTTVGDDSGWSIAAGAAAHALADLGRGARAADMVDRSMERASESDGRYEVLSADLDRSIGLWTAGRFADSARIATTGFERATRYGFAERLGSGFRGCLADAFFELGRYADVDEMTRPGIGGDGIVQTITWAALTKARASVARGWLDDAHLLLDHLRSDMLEGGFQELSEIELARADGRFDLVATAVDGVIRYKAASDRVIPIPMVLGAGIGAAADRAVAARRRRRPADASEAAENAERWLGIFQSLVARISTEGGAGPFIEALLATAEADMTRLKGASDPIAWADVVERWSALAQPHQTASARLRQAEALLWSTGDRAEVATLLRAAHETAVAIGAEPLKAEVAVVAAQARIELEEPDRSPLDGRSGDGPPPMALTARERGVLQLVAEGHTNREIGDRLFISEKTVSVHVSNAMAKLGALSRYEAAAAAERAGLL